MFKLIVQANFKIILSRSQLYLPNGGNHQVRVTPQIPEGRHWNRQQLFGLIFRWKNLIPK